MPNPYVHKYLRALAGSQFTLLFFFLQSPGIFDSLALQRLSHGLCFIHKYKKNTVM